MTRPLLQTGISGVVAICAMVIAGLLLAPATVGQETASPGLTDSGAETCLTCHNSEDMLAIFRTPHGQQADPNAPMASLQCESCHGPGGDHAGRQSIDSKHASIIAFGLDALTSIEDQDAVCTDCHDADIDMGWTSSEHAQSDVGCVGCHNVHASTDPVVSHAGQNAVCFDCHTEQQADSMKPYAHPLRTDAPVRVAAMVCTDCHNPHSSVTSGLLSRNTTNEVCFECHAEFRGPVLFDHAPVSEDCSNCHQPHGSIHPAMLTRRAPQLCQSCHSQAGHPSLSFTDDGLAGGSRPSPMLIGQSCMNCHTQVHGSNHPSGFSLMR